MAGTPAQALASSGHERTAIGAQPRRATGELLRAAEDARARSKRLRADSRALRTASQDLRTALAPGRHDHDVTSRDPMTVEASE
jgi:hypothetical protein